MEKSEIELIFTYKGGQNIFNLPLSTIDSVIFSNNEVFKSWLNGFWTGCMLYSKSFGKKKSLPILSYVSTCVYSDEWVAPDWYMQCNGKIEFY